MKTALSMVIALFLLAGSFNAQANDLPANDPVSMWDFSAPDAPYGYNNGILDIKNDDEGYAVTLSFTGMEYKFECSGVSFKDGKLSFALYLDGEDIFLSMEFENNDKMFGKASYSEGALPITAKRKVE